MTETNIDSDCLGRYFSDSAPECKICRDAVSCRKQTIAAGYYIAPATEEAKPSAQEYTTARVTEIIGKIGIPGCKSTAKKVSLFDEKDRYLDVLVSSNGMLLYCKFALSGLARYSNTDYRPFRGKIVSYETLEAMLKDLDAQRLKS